MNQTAYGQMLYCIQQDEMREHLKKRIEYHRKREEEELKKADRLQFQRETGLREATSVTERLQIQSQTDFQNAARDRELAVSAAHSHGRRAGRLDFFANHLGNTGPFLLNKDECKDLEFFAD